MRQLIVAAVVALVATTAPSRADAQVETFEARTVLFSQTGRGHQSLDGNSGEGGNQQALIVEPLLYLKFRQIPTLVHEVTVEIDVVSAASPDAIDATTSASRINESFGLDVTHRWSHDGKGEVFGRWGLHVEEPLRSIWMGGGYTRRLADDNFTFTVSGMYSYDSFDAYGPYGDRPGLRNRYLGNGNASISQVLSPTTIIDLGYGYTFQTGVLETTWNATPTMDGTIERESFPDSRSRHAATVRLSQMFPRTRTTGKLSYRVYSDDFGVDAHTVQLYGYQYLKPWLYGRAGWRVHRQDGADFYADVHPDQFPGSGTSDSDLAPFTSQEWSGKLVLLGDRAPFRRLRRTTLEASFGHYARSNDLRVLWSSLSMAFHF